MEFDEERLEALHHEENCQTTRELAEQLGCSPQAVLNHLNSMGKVQKLGAWVPHQLNQNKNQRVAFAASLLARHHLAVQ